MTSMKPCLSYGNFAIDEHSEDAQPVWVFRWYRTDNKSPFAYLPGKPSSESDAFMKLDSRLYVLTKGNIGVRKEYAVRISITVVLGEGRETFSRYPDAPGSTNTFTFRWIVNADNYDAWRKDAGEKVCMAHHWALNTIE